MTDSHKDPGERARRLFDEGRRLIVERDNWAGAAVCFREAHAFYAKHGPPEMRAQCAHILGAALHTVNKCEEAAAYLREACAFYVQYGPSELRARCEHEFGVTLGHLGQYAEAEGYLRGALIHFCTHGPLEMRAQCAHNLGIALHRPGRDEEGLPYFEAAAWAWAEIDREDFATQSIGEAEEICKILGDAHGQVTYRLLQDELRARWRRRQGLAPPPLTAGQQACARATAWSLVAGG